MLVSPYYRLACTKCTTIYYIRAIKKDSAVYHIEIKIKHLVSKVNMDFELTISTTLHSSNMITI